MTPILGPALSALGLEARSMAEVAGALEVNENRETFTGNAALKAMTVSDALGAVALGEDSGLCVDALNGEPGVRSARYSGRGTEANIDLLLKRLRGVSDEARAARFETVAVLKVPDGPVFAGRGTATGRILSDRHGRGGFGYDPVFFSSDLGLAFGEATGEAKRAVSHRSRALRALRQYLFEAFPGSPSSRPRPARIPGQAEAFTVSQAEDSPAWLLTHELAVARLCREMACLLVEAGHDVDPNLAGAAGLLHDIAKARYASGRARPGDPTSLGERAPAGVADHAWHSAAWAFERGYDPRLVRAIMVHGLDSLLSVDYSPAGWEERILMLADKLAEDVYVGLERRIAGLKERHPQATGLVDRCAPVLRELERVVAEACGLTVAEFNRDLASCLDVVVLPAEAGPEEVERGLGSR